MKKFIYTPKLIKALKYFISLGIAISLIATLFNPIYGFVSLSSVIVILIILYNVCNI